MDYLYPTYNDKEFNIKIATKKEFSDLKTDQKLLDPEEESERLCNMAFELRPHQQFVRNFMSINTPYNSVLLYHGLGTGKTCSAIGVCEEMRDYMKQANINKRIIIVASPNVQENFKLQLFDDRKLKQINGVWNIEACSGKQFLNEINPTNLKNLSKERVLSQIARIIRTNYLFLGYIEFGNYIEKVMKIEKEGLTKEEKKKLKKKKLMRVFKNRLIVIDEVHNIRLSDDNKDKRIAINLMKVAEIVDGTRLLFLSATPMYNSYKEIIWLLNLMNTNNGHAPINESSIFDKQGNFITGGDGEPIGRNKLLNVSRGLISFVRGDNPYTFPFRIYPFDFDKKRSSRGKDFVYPEKTINDNPIIQTLEYLDLCLIPIGEYQNKIYEKIITTIKTKNGDKKNLPTVENMEKFGYTVLQRPIEALNMVYPQVMEEDTKYDFEAMVGKNGLNRIMTHEMNNGRRTNYNYKKDFVKQFGKIFTKELIGLYSGKISNICNEVLKTDGIVLVYSQYLDGGLLPVALALEENGFVRFDSKDGLLKTSKKRNNSPTYVMITGDKTLSVNNAEAVKASSSEENKDGSKIKVILVSRAGSEGLDFKNIRQIHIMEPWYNTNRIEQIIGRGVRNCSHKSLSFSKRNVMVFMYGTILKNKTEAADMYVYRVAEEKAVKIGNVSRVLKEGAIDCLLHEGQSGLTEENFNMTKEIVLANGKKINYKIGDKKYSQLCDFMENCEYKCIPELKNKNDADFEVNTHTYDEHFIKDVENLKRSIKRLFANHYFYKKKDLLKILTSQHRSSIEQIYFALNALMNSESEFLVDMYGRSGSLVNIGSYYFFQPNELEHIHSSLFEKSRPMDYKREKLMLIQKKKKKVEKPELFDKGEYTKLIDILEKRYKTTQIREDVKRGDTDWYKHCANSLVYFESFNLEEGVLEHLVVTHIVDMLVLKEKLLLLNYLFYTKNKLSLFEKKLKKVIEEKMIGEKSIFIQNKGITKLYIREKNAWKEGEKTDYIDINKELQEIALMRNDLNNLLGFIIEFDNSYFVFKTKNLKLKRHRGARCDQGNKDNRLKTLNAILKGDNRTPSKSIIDKMNKIETCCFMEILLRLYNKEKRENKVWFLTPEYSKFLQIEEFILK